MSLQYHPRARTILLCDFSKGGFMPPEMIKRRPAIVVCDRLPHRANLCTVIPLSGTEPEHAVPYVVRIELPQPLPDPFPQTIWWAKCDMAATVCFDRLDLFRTQRDQNGKRKYLEIFLPQQEFSRVCQGILNGLGFMNLTYEP